MVDSWLVEGLGFDLVVGLKDDRPGGRLQVSMCQEAPIEDPN